MKHLRINLAILCVLFIGCSPLSHASQSPTNKLTKSKVKATQSQQINAAIRKSRTDLDYTFFVVCLPDDKADAKTVHELWSKQAKVFAANNTPVFFVRGANAQEMLRKSFAVEAPTYITFRSGQPCHTRSGYFDAPRLNNFINLALNPSSPATPGPDQLAFAFQHLDTLVREEKNNEAARLATEYAYTIHLLTNVKDRLIWTYSTADFADFSVASSMAELTLAELHHKDPSVATQINEVREIAKAEWEANGQRGTAGIGFWMETAFLSDSLPEVTQWVEELNGHPVTIQVLQDYGSSISSELIKNKQWEAFAHTFKSVDFMKQGFVMNLAMIEREDSQFTRDSVRDMNQFILQDATMYHGALLAVGRDQEAWDIVNMLTEFADPSTIALAVCNAAMKTGSITQRHIEIAKKLPPKDKEAFFKDMQSAAVTGLQYD